MKSAAFVDKRCPVCGGKGCTRKAACVRCKGTGMIGSYEEVDVPERRQTPFGKIFLEARRAANIPLRMVSFGIGITVTRLSEIESGIGEPITIEEASTLLHWLCSRVSSDDFALAFNLAAREYK